MRRLKKVVYNVIIRSVSSYVCHAKCLMSCGILNRDSCTQMLIRKKSLREKAEEKKIFTIHKERQAAIRSSFVVRIFFSQHFFDNIFFVFVFLSFHSLFSIDS